MMPRKYLALLCLLSPSSVWAQPLSVGVTGGVGLTDAFVNENFQFTLGLSQRYSQAKDYLVGPSVEVRLPFRLAVEFDALYRPLHLTLLDYNGFTNVQTISQGTISTWEFPLLGKYRLPGRLIRPFVEAGPSFRHTETNTSLLGTAAFLLGNASLLSGHGVTVGGGGEIHLWKLRIAPEIRYTRWAAESFSFPLPTSELNQAELLVGLSF